MADSTEDIPPDILVHLREVTKTSGLPDTETSFDRIASSWVEKNRLFGEQIRALEMADTDGLNAGDTRGAIMLTASGSLISFGTTSDGVRWAEYASIRLRKNVPGLAIFNRTRMTGDARTGEYLEFEDGPIRRTSRIYRIAVCAEDVPVDEQEKRIREGTRFLAHAFVKVNRTLLLPAGLPEKYTTKSMVGIVAAHCGLPRKQVKEIVDEYLLLAEAGVLTGKRVPLGRLGKLYLRVQPARKARVARNPRTGGEITVEARAETAVPRMSFSRYLKQRAAVAPAGDRDGEEP